MPFKKQNIMKQILILVIILLLSSNWIQAQKNFELNTELMNSTFKIQGLNGSFGTAFVLGKPLYNDSTKARYVLVTADHVLKEMKGDSAIIYLRRKNNNATYTKIEYKIEIRKDGKQSWVTHNSADVAALYISLPKYVNLNLLGVGTLGMDDIYEKIDIHPGDEFLCLGFPLGQESNEYGFPIARKGILASYPVVPSKTTKSFLLDIKIFKGNSGGPVYFVQSGRTYRGTLHAETTQFIAGLVSKERLSFTTVKSAYKASIEAQQLDLAEIVPAIFIKETIDKLQ